MFAEFVLPYQLPILERFGLNCYGCCEPLDQRWSTLKQLRRASVSPLMIVFSWRPGLALTTSSNPTRPTCATALTRESTPSYAKDFHATTRPPRRGHHEPHPHHSRRSCSVIRRVQIAREEAANL